MVIHNYIPVIQSEARSSPLRNPTRTLVADERNIGGKKLIHDQHYLHRHAVSNIKSVVGGQMKPPHAHINQVKGDKTAFGIDKKHRKMYRISRKAIQNRPLVNINKEL
jgi:hypothetical protein